jgi:hypothetical protein
VEEGRVRIPLDEPIGPTALPPILFLHPRKVEDRLGPHGPQHHQVPGSVPRCPQHHMALFYFRIHDLLSI